MGDVKALIADPEFQQLDMSTKRHVLSQADPSFKALNDDEMSSFLSSAVKPGPASQPPRTFGGDFMRKLGDNVLSLGDVFTDPVGTVTGMFEPVVSPLTYTARTAKNFISQTPGENAADFAFNAGPALLGMAGGRLMEGAPSGGSLPQLPLGARIISKFVPGGRTAVHGYNILRDLAASGEAVAAPKRFDAGAPPRPGTTMFPQDVATPKFQVAAPPKPVIITPEAEPAMGKPLPLQPVGKANFPVPEAERAMAPGTTPPAYGTRQQPYEVPDVVKKYTVEKPPAPKPQKVETIQKFTVDKPPKPGSSEPVGPAPMPEHPVTGKVEKIPNVGDVPADYMEDASNFRQTLGRKAFDADSRVAAHLKSKGMTPEQWMSATDDVRNAHLKEAGVKSLDKHTRRQTRYIQHIFDRLSDAWGR